MGSADNAASPIAPTSTKSTPPPKSASPNVRHVVLGDIIFNTWYPSYYPEELKLCCARDEPPPGRLIYSKDGYAIYEIDGEEHQLFSQNLSLFAKLFLDNKSVFFDVASFNYYLLVHNAPSAPSPSPDQQIIGFFSKEKMSWDNNNLACILIFPPWQLRGLGKILMGISYELSRMEDRIGGPEKPLSELGRIGYLKFWEARVANAIIGMKNKSTVTVEEIAESCWMLAEDVVSTLKEMDVLGTEKRRDGSLVISKAKVREWIIISRVNLTQPVDEEGFVEDFLAEEETS
ncbi:MAG: hypothetical protein Q9170_001263 [Blastenia crenularia]